MSALLAEPLRYWAKVTPSHPAVVFAGKRTVTYSELDRWVDATAHLFLDSGCRAGDRLGILGQNSIEWCIAALSALRAGLTVVPLNSRLRQSELSYLIDQSDPALIVADADLLETVDAPAGVALLSVEKISDLQDSDPHPFPPAEIDENEPAAIVFTSGTTARPKGVVYTHRTVSNYIFEQALMLRAYRQGIRLLFVLPLAGAPGLLSLTHMTTHGGTYYFEPGFDPSQTLERLVDEKIQAFWGVPVIYDKVAALPQFADADLSAIEIATIGSTRIQQSTIDRWIGKGVIPLRHYGMTEAGGSSTISTREDAIAHPDSVGRGGVFTQHRVVRADGTDCDCDEPGEIIIRGPSVTPGYWRNEEATKQVLKDGWLYSGDIGTFGKDGCLRFIDRRKDLIVTRGGHNIAPAEIEAIVADLSDVDEVAVVSAVDPVKGEVPIVVVGAETSATSEVILAHCKMHLADYKMPHAVVHFGLALPRNSLGKISKRDLRDAIRAREASADGTARGLAVADSAP